MTWERGRRREEEAEGVEGAEGADGADGADGAKRAERAEGGERGNRSRGDLINDRRLDKAHQKAFHHSRRIEAQGHNLFPCQGKAPPQSKLLTCARAIIHE